MANSLGRARFTQAAAALMAPVASFCTVYAIGRFVGADVQPAIVAAILAIGLSRRATPARAGHIAASFATLALIAVVAGGVGWLLHRYTLVGAAVFTAGLVTSVWLRNFAGSARKAGALIALPLVSLLVVPPPMAATHRALIADLILAAVAGAIALAYVTLIQAIARRSGIALVAEPIEMEQPARTAGRVSAPTRMALQLGVALCGAFAIGLLVFPKHWGWAVLTAFIVSNGARGRGDALYKGVLRLGGALAGTIAATLLAHVWLPTGPAEAVAIFVVLFAGLWLRDVNYAYWAACMTLILAMLGGVNVVHSGAMLTERLAAILAGALCAVVAAWFVLPIRTEAIVRLRLAQALAALDEFVSHEHPSPDEHFRRRARYEYAMDELESVAPPLLWHDRLFVRGAQAHHPAHWIALSRDVRSRARTIAPDARTNERKRAALHRAIGLSRRAIANHSKPDRAPDELSVSDALGKVREMLAPPID